MRYQPGTKLIVTNECIYRGIGRVPGSIVRFSHLTSRGNLMCVTCEDHRQPTWEFYPEWVRPLTKLDKALK